MPATYEPIASVTLGSSASTVDFTSIAGTYTDLVLVCHVRGSASSAGLKIRFNSDSGSNYSTTTLWGDGSSASSGRLSNQTQNHFAQYAGGLNVDNFTVTVCHIMSYANTNVNKTYLSAYANAATEATRHVGLWRSTAAITSVNIREGGSSSWTSGSTFALYGIKAA